MQGASPLPREQLRGGAAPGGPARAQPRGDEPGWSRRRGGSPRGPGPGCGERRGGGGETGGGEDTETETTAERNGQRRKGRRKGRDTREEDERRETWNYRETADKTERREASTGPCSSFCIEISFVNFFFFCNIKKTHPLPQDVLCFSGRVAVSPSPPPPSERRRSQHGARAAYLQAGRAGGGALPGGRAGGRGTGRGYVQRGSPSHGTHRLSTEQQPVGFLFSFLQRSSY